MKYLQQLNEFLAGFMTGKKTLIATLILTAVSLYANTKGFSAAEMEAWIKEGVAHVNSLIVILGAMVAWFRRLADITKDREVKEASKPVSG